MNDKTILTKNKTLVSEHQHSHVLNEEESNGLIFAKLDCTIDEYARQVNAKNLDDVQWTG